MEESIASGSGKSTDFVTHRWVYFTERLSIEYQKTQTKVISAGNQNKRKYLQDREKLKLKTCQLSEALETRST